MELKPIEISPFSVDESAIRQLKASCGESEGGWRMDLVLTNQGRKRMSRLTFSLRYYSAEGEFLGLDKVQDYENQAICSGVSRDYALHISPLADASYAELRIFSVTGFKALLDDDPWWLAPLAIIVVVLIVVAWSFLAR